MNTTPAAAGPGFLAALIPLTRYDESFEVTIKADHFSLDVTVEACGHKPLKASGTPAALERALPAAIAKYAQWVEAQELAGDDDDGVKIDLPGEKARARAPMPKKAAPRVRKAAPKRARKAAPKWGYIKRNGLQDKKNRRTINADDKLKPHTTRSKRIAAATTQAGRAGKPECIADYKALKAKHGDKLTRRLFVDTAKTGRRYEKLWANNWPSFVKEAEGQKSTSAAAPTTAAPAKLAAPTPKKAPAKSAAPTPSKPAKDDKRPWTVKAKGKTLGATILDKKTGDHYVCSAGTFTVQSVDAEKREIHVLSVFDAAREKPSAETAAPKDETAPPPAPAVKKQIPYAIKTAEGTTLGAIVQELAIGAKWGPFNRWEVTVVDHDKREYTVKDTTATADAAAPAPATTATEQPK